MAVSFLDAAERGELNRMIDGNGDLQKFNSAAPTLHNTPNPSPPRSRDGSPTRKTANTLPMSAEQSFSTLVDTTNRYTMHEMDVGWMGSVIIVCFFTSGCIDAVAFNSWNCFVGMQTGNTVFAALGISGQPTASHFQQYYKSLVSIGAFCFGTLFFNALHRWPTGIHNQPTSRRRIVFVLSFFVQTALIVVAAALVTVGLVSNQPFVAGTFSSGNQHNREGFNTTNYVDLVPIAILAFESAGQVCLSRVLSLIELPTIVLSTLYHDFTADLYGTLDLWRKSTSVPNFVFVQARRQEKRFMSIVALFVGAFIGGEMYKSSAGMAGALWLGAALKLCVTVAFCLWKKESPKEADL